MLKVEFWNAKCVSRLSTEGWDLINYIYQLVSPKVFSIKYEDINFSEGVIIKPLYMSICHADQRYYLGQRDPRTLEKKLPMALIHECCGEIVEDKSEKFKKGQKVVVVPNTPVIEDKLIYENYRLGSYFLSSGHDGFMREFINIDESRVVPFNNINDKIASITEFVSVAVHSVDRFNKSAHENRNTIGIWGDGSLSYVLSCVIKATFPNSNIVVVGKDIRKLSHFSFVNKTFLAEEIPDDFRVDHAFECAGGEGSYYAIDDIIKYINPQGCVMLMGVSENKVSINTRDILEKGLTFVGTSRSGVKDFERAVALMERKSFQRRLSVIIYEDDPVCSVEDIHRVFRTDLNTPFKTVFKWNL